MSRESRKNKAGKVMAILLALILITGIGFLLVRFIQMKSRIAAAPDIEVIQPDANKPSILNIPQPVNVLASSKNHNVTSVEWYLDGMLAGQMKGDRHELRGNWYWTPEIEGLHQLTFLARNEKGNMSQVSLEVSVITGADIDGDGVPDELDQCKNEPGPEASSGCLLDGDRDEDGLIGEADLCPDEVGSPESAGCPNGMALDGDADGIPDHLDLCAYERGLPDWDGCPLNAWSLNSDGDELPDFLDDCPEDFGPRETGGCPNVSEADLDGDGMADASDACPDRPGSMAESGCPISDERDGDGVPDAEDLCPDESGPISSGGCPMDDLTIDSDMDGVPDAFDACLEETGSFELGGCPSTEDPDGDGLVDSEDNCPDETGSVFNHGCPFVSFPWAAFALQDRIFPEFVDPCMIDPSACPPEPEPEAGGMGGGGTFYCSANDEDHDGVLDLEDDLCVELPGRPLNDGCPRAGDRDSDGVLDSSDPWPDIPGPNHGAMDREISHVRIFIDNFISSTALAGIYCYGGMNGSMPFERIPAWDYLDDSFSIIGPEIVIHNDEYIFLNIHCWGQPANLTEHSVYLGSINCPYPWFFWDGQVHKARGSYDYGWFEIWFRIQQLSYYEM